MGTPITALVLLVILLSGEVLVHSSVVALSNEGGSWREGGDAILGWPCSSECGVPCMAKEEHTSVELSWT